MTAITYPHIVRDSEGVLRIDGTGYKVLVLLNRHVVRGTTAEEFVDAHEKLTLAQAHAMLGYYYDNKAELDDELRRREEEAERLAAKLIEPSALAAGGTPRE